VLVLAFALGWQRVSGLVTTTQVSPQTHESHLQPPRIRVSHGADLAAEELGPRDISIVLFSSSKPWISDEQDVLAPHEEEWWIIPFTANVALLAFQEGAVLRGPAAWCGYNFHIIFADTCPDGIGGERCGSIWSIQQTHRHFGHSWGAHSFGNGSTAPRAAIAGRHYVTAYAQMLGAMGVPTISYSGQERVLSDNLEYPYFLRASTAQRPRTLAALAIMQHFNLTKAVLWHGTSRTEAELRNECVEQAFLAGVNLGTMLYQPGPSNIEPPAEDSERGVEWRSLLQRAWATNAHVHILSGTSADPTPELYSWLHWQGLRGAGLLWIHFFPLHVFYERALSMVSLLAPSSPYARALDGGGGTFDVQSENVGSKGAAFDNYWRSMQNRTFDLEPWIREKISEQPGIWSVSASDSTFNHHVLFDSIWALLLVMNDLLRHHGADFTSEELYDKLLGSDFEGASGRMAWNENGDREPPVKVSQYQLPSCTGQSSELQQGIVEIELPVLVRVGDFNAVEGLVLTKELFFYNCSKIAPPDESLPCMPGTYYDYFEASCKDCPAGKVTREIGKSTCESCSPGTFSNLAGGSVCLACSAGRFSNASAATTCTSCIPGRYQDEVLQSRCRTCPLGTYSDSGGAALCRPCATGSYSAAKGATSCEACSRVVDGSTTAQIGSSASSDCVCPEGSYLPAAASFCQPCPKAMTCALGSSLDNYWMQKNASVANSQDSASLAASYDPHCAFPLAMEGFMTLPGNPLEVYMCVKAEHCLGGVPGMCAQRRDSNAIACGRCVQDTHPYGSSCRECPESSLLALWPLLGGVVAVSIVTALVITVNGDMRSTPATALFIITVSGMIFTSIQALGVFGEMQIDWAEPLQTAVQTARLMTFDLQLLRLSCFWGHRPIVEFAVSQAIAPATPATVACILFCLSRFHCVRHTVRLRFTELPVMAQMANSVGSLYSIFFISILISALEPFICYKHPGGSGQSMRSAPEVLCFADDPSHMSLVMIGLTVLFAFPVPFLVMCGWASYMYPYYMVRSHSTNFLHGTRFLFLRVNPDRHYFQVLLLMRGLLLCLVPVVLSGKPSSQGLFITILLGCYVILEEEMRPWRAKHCNVFDAVLNILLMIVLFIGALLLDGRSEKDTMVMLSTIALGLLVLAAGCGFGLLLWRRWFRSHFDFFICHHKESAAAQARLLKMLLQQKRNGIRVFIDADDLRDLTVLFDIIRCRVRHLIVYLTVDTLRRAWCAGEITTAYLNKVKASRVETPTYVRRSMTDMSSIESCGEWLGTSLVEHGIQVEEVVEALEWLLSETEAYHLQQNQCGVARFRTLVSQLLHVHVESYGTGGVLDATSSTSPAPHLANMSGHVVISTVKDSDEANAAGGILLAEIAKDVYRLNAQGVHLLADYQCDLTHIEIISLAPLVSAGVVVLSSGTMSSLEQLHMMCALMAAQAEERVPAVIPVHTPTFEFPSYAQLEAVGNSLGHGFVDPVKLLRSFYMVLSVTWPTHASQSVLRTQAMEVVHRIRTHLEGGCRPSSRLYRNPSFNRSRTLRSMSQLSFSSSRQGSKTSLADVEIQPQRSTSFSSLPPSPSHGSSPFPTSPRMARVAPRQVRITSETHAAQEVPEGSSPVAAEAGECSTNTEDSSLSIREYAGGMLHVLEAPHLDTVEEEVRRAVRLLSTPMVYFGSERNMTSEPTGNSYYDSEAFTDDKVAPRRRGSSFPSDRLIHMSMEAVTKSFELKPYDEDDWRPIEC